MSLLNSFVEISRVIGTDIRPGDIFIFDTHNLMRSEIKFRSLGCLENKHLTVRSVNIVRNYGDNSVVNHVLKYCGEKVYAERGIMTSVSNTLEFIEESSPIITVNGYDYYNVKKLK